ncbi:MAG: MOSC domain-containing protein [Planctomycetota bacterium]|jgi:MOSC domain-containing protein YiiM
MHIKSVSVGKIKNLSFDGLDYQSAVDKYASREPVRCAKLGLEGDEHANAKGHGGEHRALMICCIEHYPFFSTHAGRELAAPAFGENLTAYGMTEREVCIGDRYKIGDEVVVEVSQPREPCTKLDRKHGGVGIKALMDETGFTGYCLRVLVEGELKAGDSVELLERPEPELTVELAFQTLFGSDPPERPDYQRFVDCEYLSPKWREWMAKKIEEVNAAE